MPAYLRTTVGKFLESSVDEATGTLERAYADDGFVSQYTAQTVSWSDAIVALQSCLARVLVSHQAVRAWTVLLEYPLYRLRRRIDLVLLAGETIVVVECKTLGAASGGVRQIEEYALDLRDFHSASAGRRIIPIAWSVRGECAIHELPSTAVSGASEVQDVLRVDDNGLVHCLMEIASYPAAVPMCGILWDNAAYRPVPGVIEAATAIFSKHTVRDILNADADNLRAAAARLLTLIRDAKQRQRSLLVFVSGVPGSGKTLAGLTVVHKALASGIEDRGDIVYLSGNTPLVAVLREALARDEYGREQGTGGTRRIGDIRRDVRARIQHINDFIRDSLASTDRPPHEHVIVFDEAQRAWDHRQGLKKFDRSASEPKILLDIMSRHRDWCVCICLIGGGQEINAGEEGVLGWGRALASLSPAERSRWSVFAPHDVIYGGASAGTYSLGELPTDTVVALENDLQLRVPQRMFRSPQVSQWVDAVLDGRADAASICMQQLERYPICLTRSLSTAKEWLERATRGERRHGLFASSGARRLRAEGIGGSLDSASGDDVPRWYLNRRGDIRSSFALEVAANEYTCQGLELDFGCVCWGGDFLWAPSNNSWTFSRLAGTAWNRVLNRESKEFIRNSYRVLLTRAREGLVIWVPAGSESDPTRAPDIFDATAAYLVKCGARLIDTA